MRCKDYPKRRYKLFQLVILFLMFNSISIIFISSNHINLKDKNENPTNIINDKNDIVRIASNNPPKSHYFKYYKPITINHEMVSGSGTHINFPVLISILDEELHNHVNQSNGNDIAFANDSDWLDHEIEFFNHTYSSTHAKLVAWVRIPSLSTSVNTTIYMYYGNSTMGSRQNPTGVWDSSYRGVWHLSELSGSAVDSTSYGTSGTVSPGGVSRGATGQIDGAYDFGNNGQVNFGDPGDGHLDMGTGSFTISLWLNIDCSIDWYQLPLYKGSEDQYHPGYDFETNQDATSLSFRICDDSENLGESPFLDINFDSWMYITGVVDRTLSRIRIYKNGLQVDFGNNIASIGNINSDQDFLASAAYGSWEIDGLIDEIRICNITRSAGWIATEYNNQDDPQSFLNIGLEESLDNTPPTYSNLIESSDPLELGQTEVITINVSDPYGINQVKIEFTGTNHSMINIGGDTWQYDSWTPSAVGNYSYTIWMEDNYHNWNSTVGNIEVIDYTPPTYSNLIESADPLQFGQNETIEIKVFDLSGVNQTLIEYGLSPKNHSMVFQGANKWSWSKWQPTIGVHTYKIYMQDNQNNWNMTSGNITVITIYAPFIENLTKSEDPLELGNDIIITVDVFDNETWVDTVLIELDGINRTMSNISGNSYEYLWNSSDIIESGYSVGLPITINFKIYANDSDNNWNSLSSSFDIIDTTDPSVSSPFESNDPLELGNVVKISVNSTDLSDIYQVKIYFEGSNHSMTKIGGNTWQYNLSSPNSVGNYSYTIWAEDYNNNWNFISDSILVQDTTPPSYSNLTEIPKIVELGTTLTISVKATDLANIKEVLIEYENSNHSMEYAGEDIWDCDFWIPNSIGNYTYKIFIRDYNENLNYLKSWILFEDNVIPIYSNLIEGADPLELGDNQVIRINTYDFAGINRTLIEFEGANHSMINIYGNTWEFDSWNPNNWTFYYYTIYVEDHSGNWNFVIGNITVQDTTPPSPPILTNAPSGDVSGILVFDWADGYDPSGISYYLLIIDNETDPLITPGYVYKFNITNIGSESSYYELTDALPSSKHYYFLAQIDGAGHQSDYTMGSFTINLNPNDNSLMIYIIIAVIVVSAVGSISAITIIRRKSHKKMGPPRKRISFKGILTHISKLTSPELTSDDIKLQNELTRKEINQYYSEELPVEGDIEIDIDEIKALGEELFSEGAYLEAIKQFQQAREILSNQDKNEEVALISDLIAGIEGLIEEREKRLEILEQLKLEGNSVEIFELFDEIIDISKNLRDLDSASFYQSGLTQFFQINKMKLLDLKDYRNILEQKADSLLNDNQFKIAAQIYEKCERITEIFIQSDRDEEITNFEKYRKKKAFSLNRLKEKQSKGN